MRTRLLLGSAASIAAVALVTGAVYALRPVAPDLSLGVLYVFAVLPIAAVFGIGFAIPVSVVSMLAFNWFFLPPRHTFELRDSENWVALAVYLVTAASVSSLAAQARRRAHEAEAALAEREALSRSDAAKTAVLRSVSHDLRSPLTAIGAASELLADPDALLGESDRAELFASIRDQARRLDRLVANLLDLSRLEAGAASPLAELWPVDELVGRALDGVGADGERVTVSLPADVPAVRVDAAQVERVLVNLVENALWYSSSTDPVEVRAAAGGGEVVISVSDRGPGVDVADRESIFEPFWRGRGAGERGSGLGLAIARGFAGVNGGRVWVESEPGRGATFSLALPAVEIESRVTA
jgi:two-component system, OmpR family, sensor histidine kinase KdpD